MDRIICEKRIWTIDKKTHSHGFGHLIFPLQGTLALETLYQSLTISDRSLYYLPPHCTHVFFSQNNWSECLVIDIPDFVVPNFMRLSDSGIQLDINANWKALRCLILAESYREYPSINHLLYYAFSLLQEENVSPSFRYIHDHYCEDISIETLAQLEHYNVAYYGQWFQKKMGVTLQQYIQQLRLDEAKRLLRETNFSILDIAHQVGYKYQSYLTKLFKQNEGLTPLQYKCKRQK